MSKKWHSGPPPSVGWWPASVIRDEDALRWWNGKVWSQVAFIDDQLEEAASAAGKTVSKRESMSVEWQHRPASWPERSRT